MAMTITEQDRIEVLRCIEVIEEGKISNLQFDFIKDREMETLLNRNIDEIIPILERLRDERMVMLITRDTFGLPSDDDTVKKYFVKSKIAHIVNVLNQSKARSGATIQNNVGDIKYVRNSKRRPIRNISTSQILTDPEIRNYLSLTDEISLHNQILNDVIQNISRNRFTQISRFQFTAIKEILKKLHNKSTHAEGISIVAETGTGKTLAYQLPLVLWILHKKLEYYKKQKDTGNDLHPFTSALLIFPRNVLATDQYNAFKTLATLANQVIATSNLTRTDSELSEFLEVKVENDYGGTAIQDRKNIYWYSKPDVIITNTSTLKKRLYDPMSHQVYQRGIDLVLYDEVHLYEGLEGSYICGLNTRLVNTLLQYSNAPIFVGMSATINTPEKHCQKLFGLKDEPRAINDNDDPKEESFVEHHIIIKPRLGRYPLGVLLDTTSCLIHNRRREGLGNRPPDSQNLGAISKSITFIQSRNLVYQFERQLNDLEIFDFPKRLATFTQNGFRREYGMFYNPEQENYPRYCDNCKGVDCVASHCDSYNSGNCWFFSQDDGGKTVQYGNWVRPVANFVEYPPDNIRSSSLTAAEWKKRQRNADPDSIFYWNNHEVKINDRNASPNRWRISTTIDNIISTPVLEVGVDIRHVEEIINYGDIQSPASYKQRAGRGARHGFEDTGMQGLAVMTVIFNSPLSNFYFRHFDRLVYPQLSPIKLEVKNPEIIKTQCFSSVFDFFAIKTNKGEHMDLFSLKDPKTGIIDPQSVATNYANAINLIENNKTELEDYLKKFLDKFNAKHEIIGEVLVAVLNLLRLLNSEISIPNPQTNLTESESLALWMARSENNTIFSQFKNFFSDMQERLMEENKKAVTSKNKLNVEIQRLENKPIPDELQTQLTKWRDEL